MATELQKSKMRLSEIRSRLAELGGTTEHTDETRAEVGTLRTELIDVETKYQALEAIEVPVKFPQDSAEGREFRALEKRSTLAGFISGIHNGNLDGAEKEFREAILGEGFGASDIPLSMLLPRTDPQVEERAVTTVAAAALTEGNQESIAGRVFARSVPAYLGIPMPSVPAGSAGFPRLSGGTTFSVQSPSGEQLPVAGTFAGVELAPIRATGGYDFRVEDISKLVGIEDTLRADLRAGMDNLLNAQAVNGDGTAPNVSGILNAVAATPTTTPSNADDFGDIVARVMGEVDGAWANSPAELRMAMRSDIFAHMATVYRGNQSETSAYAYLSSRMGGAMVSNIIPAISSNYGSVIIHKTGGGQRSVIMPVWSAFGIVADPYTLASKGEIRITAALQFNFAVLDTDAFVNMKVRTS